VRRQPASRGPISPTPATIHVRATPVCRRSEPERLFSFTCILMPDPQVDYSKETPPLVIPVCRRSRPGLCCFSARAPPSPLRQSARQRRAKRSV